MFNYAVKVAARPGNYPLRDASRLLTILAMAGLGFGVELAAVRIVGVRVGVAVILTLLFLAASTLVLIRVLHIDG